MFPGLDPGPLVDELRERLTEELDYTNEAENQRFFADTTPATRSSRSRASIDELSTARVLTTELADGARFAEVGALVTGGTQPRRRGDLPLRVPQPLPAPRVQRGPASGQLPVRPGTAT